MSDLENRRKKLLYRSWYRGCKETDKILGYYARKNLMDFDATQLDEFEAILDQQDVDIYDWISGKQPVPEIMKGNKLLSEIISFSFTDEFSRQSGTSN